MSKPYFIKMAFQHYPNEYNVPVVVGRLDVSSVRVRLRPENIRYVQSVSIYSLESHVNNL